MGVGMRVLVTRPKEDNGRTADLLVARGHAPVLAPLFEVVGLPHHLPADTDATLVTSANGLRMVQEEDIEWLRGRTILTVGDATAAQAVAMGFTRIHTAGGGSTDLARLVRETVRPGTRILQLAARHRRDAAVQSLQGEYRLMTVETYDTVAVQALPEPIIHRLRVGELDAALHFSPRAAQVFADLVERAGLLEAAARVIHIYISAAARDGRLPAGCIAAKPSLESVVNAL